LGAIGFGKVRRSEISVNSNVKNTAGWLLLALAGLGMLYWGWKSWSAAGDAKDVELMGGGLVIFVTSSFQASRSYRANRKSE
jgi:hypothetical protein